MYAHTRLQTSTRRILNWLHY